MQTFTAVFVAALLLTTAVRMWLATRHIRHVRAHRASVPDNFSAQIDLAAHQKAADYTCAKTRLGYLNILLEAILLLALTLGGGLNALAAFWSDWLGMSMPLDGNSANYPLTHGMALIISTILLMSVVEIPLSYYRTFVIEQQFDFGLMGERGG